MNDKLLKLLSKIIVYTILDIIASIIYTIFLCCIGISFYEAVIMSVIFTEINRIVDLICDKIQNRRIAFLLRCIPPVLFGCLLGFLYSRSMITIKLLSMPI